MRAKFGRGSRKMKCTKCGAEAPSQAAFCPQCGTQLRNAEASDSPASPRQAVAPRPAADVPEQELWSGGYSPPALAGSFIVAAILIVAAAVVVALTNAGPIGWSGVAFAAIVVFG